MSGRAGVVTVLVVALLGLVGCSVSPPPGPAASPATPPATGARPPTVPAPPRPGAVMVSLTFDDGLDDQIGYLATLARHGLTGTFYVNSGVIDQPGHLTRAQLDQIAAGGNEIAGHTTLHLDLDTLAPDEVRRQVCGDRATLASWGFRPTSLAYPFGSYDDAVKAAVAACGYDSARRVGGLGVPGPGCPGCIPAESVPAADPFGVRTPAEVTSSTTLADLEQTVTNAATHGGGWLPFIFHHETACPSTCGDLSTNPALLDQFSGWLADQQARGALTVRTVAQVTAGPVTPIVSPPPPPPGPAVVNASLETGPDPTVPDCWMAATNGANTATFARTGAAHSGDRAETVTVTTYANGDAKLLPRLDLGQCTPGVRSGASYTVGAWYHATARAQYDLYRRTPTGTWLYWLSSPFYGPTPTWSPATWTTPPTPPGTTGLAAGLALSSTGTLSTDDYSLVNPPPTVP